MSILEDLDLMDLLDELPSVSDFDLNDILSEFSTPGLFDAPVEEETVEDIPVLTEDSADTLPAEDSLSMITEDTEDASVPVCTETTPAPLMTEEAASVLDEDAEVYVPKIAYEAEDAEMTADEPSDEEDDSHNALLGNHFIISDILYDYGTPTDEEGVKLYQPSAQPVISDVEDDIKVYVPERDPAAAEASAPHLEGTVVFDASAFTADTETAEAAAAPSKGPGFLAKAAAAVMGLFASKKSAKATIPAVQPAEEKNDMLVLFTQDSPVEEAVPAIAENNDFEDEVVPVISETDDDDVIVFGVSEPVEEAEADHYDDGALFGDPLGISEILFELGTHEELPSQENIAPATEEVPVFSEQAKPEYIPIELPDFAETADVSPIDSEQPASTIVFDALDLTEASAKPETAESSSAAAPKAPGLLTKIVGAVMGLFASKKLVNAAAPTVQPSSAEDDPFAHLADLFADEADGELSDMDELMLELELQAEREAELEAEAAAREAAERLAREEEQKALELEAQRLAQEEADAEASRQRRLQEEARLKAEEDARIKAEADALLKQLQAEEEERQALAEDELFEWIEAAENRRRSAAAAKIPVEEPVPEKAETAVILEAPVLDEASEDTAPVYDYAAVELPDQAQEYTAPQINIQINEEVPEEVDELLEMPDVEQTSEETETPEEAAARKKKEDDELHYKPEESTAKSISSHIGKRFGAAFTAFTESDDDSDREEDLGPEQPASKAYRFFNKFINGYRFRLRVSAALCVILGWISLGLPVLGSLKNPAVAAAMCLMLLLTVMLAGADILASGVRTLLNRRPGLHTLVAVSCIASVIDAIVIIYTKGVGGYLPFCAVSAISMCFAIYGSLLYCRSQRLNFKTLDRALEPLTISVDYGIVEKDASTVYRTPGHPEGYIHHSEEEDLSETVYGIMAPFLLPAIPVLTLIAALFSNGFGDFFHIMAAMFGAAASFSALIAFPLPYFLVQRDLYATKAAIAGWAGAREIGRVSNMIVTDRDLFPDETVSIKSVRIVDNVPPQLTLSYMCSVIQRSGSCLVPAFTQLAENNDCDLLDVENFQCHEAGGLSGEIGPDNVLVASHSYMKLQGFRIPARKKDSENALFLAVNGHVIAYIIVDYKPIKSVRAGLESALRGNVEMIFAARDFNVTPLLITKKFKSATETIRFPSYNQRYEITSQTNSESAACAAVVYRKSFYSYAVVVEKARYLYRSVSSAVVLSAVSSVMGILLMFLMAVTGAGAAVTVSRLLVFMLLWLIPTLALTVSITK